MRQLMFIGLLALTAPVASSFAASGASSAAPSAVSSSAKTGNPRTANVSAEPSLTELLTQTVTAAASARYPDADLTVTVPDLPKFVRNRPCAQPTIELKGVQLLHRVAVALRCNSPAPWAAYITVSVTARQPVPTLCQPLPRGHRLREADLCPRLEDLARLAPLTLTENEAIIGMETRRALSRGATLQPGALTEPKLVSRGDTVNLEAGSHRVQISTRASAENDGRYGEQIRVTNLRSGKRLRAWVIGPGRVSARPPQG